MKLIKRLIIIVAIGVFVWLFLAKGLTQPEGFTPPGYPVTDNDRFAIYTDDSRFYMVPKYYVKYIECGCIEPHFPVFNSVEEMKNAVLEGNFTNEQYHDLRQFTGGHAMYTRICNLNKLCEPVFPENIRYHKVVLTGEYYCFYFGDGSISGVFNIINQLAYENAVDGLYNHYFEDTDRTLDETKEDTLRGGTVSYYHTSIGKEKVYMHKLQEEDKVLCIMEEYASTTSETPWRTQIWGTDGMNYYHISIESGAQPQSPEWYMDFGVKPFNAL